MRGRWWWACVVLAMSGDRCQRKRKMMGCGAEERACPVPARSDCGGKANSGSVEVDLYSRARKVLTERSPFDVPEDGSVPTSSGSHGMLPSGLTGLLKSSASRRKQKKSSSETKGSRLAEKSKSRNIWAETEEYFRDLTLPDVDILCEVSSLDSIVSRNLFSILCLGNGSEINVGSGGKVEVEDSNRVEIKEEVKEDGQVMEIDNVEAEGLAREVKITSVQDSIVGLDWLLGLKKKVSLTSERPSKKRKLLGGDAGLEKVLIASPCEGNSTLCHFCCAGDSGSDSNRLIVCNSCNVAVHQKCYGVQESVDGSWLCSWCRQKNGSHSGKRSCVLCSKQQGAMKPVHRSVGNGGSTEFAHLFCCQWMPEVYIEDLSRMEPIMNVEGIKETRKKLICSICKVKSGACVRCSHGACRTSFHPLCAREARCRLEIWGRYGCDNIELRAFCSKHSEVHDSNNSVQLGVSNLAVDSDSRVSNHLPVGENIMHKLKVGGRNGNNAGVHVETPCAISGVSGDSESQETGLSDSRSNAELVSECNNAEQIVTSNDDDVSLSDTLNFALILKKLINRRKVHVKDVALEVGITPDSLVSALSDNCLVPDLKCKIVTWFKNHAYLGTLQKNLKVKVKPVVSSESGEADGSRGVSVSDTEIPGPVAVKSVPPRRRTKSNIRILKEKKVASLSKECSTDNVKMMDGVKVDRVGSEESEDSLFHKSNADADGKNSSDANGVQDSLVKSSPKSEGEAAVPDQTSVVKADEENPLSSATVTPCFSEPVKTEGSSSVYMHPYIQKRLVEMQAEVFSGQTVGSREAEVSPVEPLDASTSCNHQNQHSSCRDMHTSDGSSFEQLDKARKLGVLELSPQDEVEGEIIYFQHRLLNNAVARKWFSDNLVFNVTKNLPQEINVTREQRWEAVVANQYLCEIREAKKQGRKDRRHKEAQAVLAAATAAAAASSRNSSFRKDVLDDSLHSETLLNNGRARPCSPMMPRAKETLSRVAVPRVSSEKHSEFFQLGPNVSKEHPRSCDICRRSETMLNPILVCSSCKVAVHLDCYRSVTESMGPWYCELCEELSSRSSGAPAVNFWDKPYSVAECGLCGGTTGAFRKSTSGQWVHAFCAEWVFDSTFKRGQTSLIEGMEAIPKGIDNCSICHRNNGVCIKCNFGHCQTTFHPACARSTGYYMNMKTVGGKWQHKAYCEKHSSEQRAKAETHRHGAEELKSLKQIRVELERLRLLCERIIKREKVKREIVLCSHDVLAMKRDHVAFSVLVQSSFFPCDVSSESATTSLRGNTDGCKSSSEAIQRSDDVTVDSTVSARPQIKLPVHHMDTDLKTEDSSTSQIYIRRPVGRPPFSGKQIPQRASVASPNLIVDGERRQKHTETFEKELIMTSDQASMKNQRLPKGYAYVPIDHLAKDKQTITRDGPGETLEEKE